jgi:hypothetical protein
MLVVLANAMAKELRRWELATDFRQTVTTENQQVLALSTTGWARCTNGCPMTKAVLAFQDAKHNGQFRFGDGTSLNSWSFAAQLVAGYDAMRTCKNNSSCPYEAHTLAFAGTGTGTGNCAVVNSYRAQKPGGGNLMLPANLKNALKFAPEPHLGFFSNATNAFIHTSMEFEPGPAYECTEYRTSPAEQGAACSCPGRSAASVLLPSRRPVPNMLFCLEP